MIALAVREMLYEIVDLVVVDEIGPWTTLETPFDTAVERGALPQLERLRSGEPRVDQRRPEGRCTRGPHTCGPGSATPAGDLHSARARPAIP